MLTQNPIVISIIHGMIDIMVRILLLAMSDMKWLWLLRLTLCRGVVGELITRSLGISLMRGTQRRDDIWHFLHVRSTRPTTSSPGTAHKDRWRWWLVPPISEVCGEWVYLTLGHKL